MLTVAECGVGCAGHSVFLSAAPLSRPDELFASSNWAGLPSGQGSHNGPPPSVTAFPRAPVRSAFSSVYLCGGPNWAGAARALSGGSVGQLRKVPRPSGVSPPFDSEGPVGPGRRPPGRELLSRLERRPTSDVLKGPARAVLPVPLSLPLLPASRLRPTSSSLRLTESPPINAPPPCGDRISQHR